MPRSVLKRGKTTQSVYIIKVISSARLKDRSLEEHRQQAHEYSADDYTLWSIIVVSQTSLKGWNINPVSLFKTKIKLLSSLYKFQVY